MVVKVSDVELQRRLGVVGREPRWAIAWKFPPTTAVTTLKQIGWNPGKFGDLHPYAMLEPVHVGGVTIKQATLHNEEDLARKDIREGEEVIVLRAGDVIPQVLVARAPCRGAQRPPAGATTAEVPGMSDADGQARGLGVHEMPKPGLPRPPLAAADALRRRDGHRRAGEKQVSLFMDLGWVRTAGDFYRLIAEQIAEQSGFGKISAEKLVAAIEASKQQPFGRVLYALGIEEVGYVTGRNLAQQFRTLGALLAATPEQIEETQGVGPKMAQMIHEQLADPWMRALLADLRHQGLTLEEDGPPPGEGPLAVGRSC